MDAFLFALITYKNTSIMLMHSVSGWNKIVEDNESLEFDNKSESDKDLGDGVIASSDTEIMMLHQCLHDQARVTFHWSAKRLRMKELIFKTHETVSSFPNGNC